MTMLRELHFSEARKEFTHLYNQVYDEAKPVLIRRHKTEEVVALRADLQKLILQSLSFHPKVLPEDDESVTLAIDVLEMVVNAATLTEAKHQLATDLIDYANDYLERPQLFLAAPNRRGHFPYVLRILLCDNIDEVKTLLE